MATKYINSKYTLLDRAKETSDGKTVLPIISVMNELVDDFFMDVPFMEANMGLKHKIVRDTGMVASTKRTFYKGVTSSKRNKQVVGRSTRTRSTPSQILQQSCVRKMKDTPASSAKMWSMLSSTATRTMVARI